MFYARLSNDNLDEMFAVHQAAIAAVGRPDLVKPESLAFFRRILSGAGRVIGVYRDDALVAYGVLQLDLPPSEDARPLLGLSLNDSLAKLAGASVLPREWGAGIHNALINQRIAEARRLGIAHLYSTSAPGNAPSWENLLDAGFRVRGLIEKYGGQLRYLLYLDLSAPAPVEIDGAWCDTTDSEKQRLLIANGLSGIGWRRSPDGGREIFYGGRS